MNQYLNQCHSVLRYARTDAAKRLLEAGADPNAADNTGRTPLHSAVAADAQGVLAILLRHRAANVNARMLDGTTPLILAARLAVEGTVKELINAGADINAADEYGKWVGDWGGLRGF
jgi:ankyrin repeat protein